MFRGKESSNRIELSRLVQVIEFWCFGIPVALGVGMGGCAWGWLRGAPHTCACTCMHSKHNFMQIGEIPGNSL